MNYQRSADFYDTYPEQAKIDQLEIQSEKHCFRSLSGQSVNSVTAARTHINLGSEVQKIHVTLRHPEICIFDVSNPSSMFLDKSAREISELFAALREATVQFCATNPEFTLITGDGLDTEICLSGPSKSHLASAKSQILNSMQKRMPKGADPMHPVIAKSRPIRLINEECSEFLKRFCFDYSQMLIPDSWRHCRLLSLAETYSLHPLWREIGEASDGFCFVLGGGMPLHLTIMEMVGPRPTIFFEYHRQNDANDLVRAPHTNFEMAYNWGDRSVRSASIIDKVYSGGSLQMAADRFSELYPDVQAIKIGLFPKSLQGVLLCDKVVFAGKLLDVAPLRANLHPDNWHWTLWECARS